MNIMFQCLLTQRKPESIRKYQNYDLSIRIFSSKTELGLRRSGNKNKQVWSDGKDLHKLQGARLKLIHLASVSSNQQPMLIQQI